MLQKHSGLQTYREYGCGYGTAQQGLHVIRHHFLPEDGQGVVVQSLFVVHIEPPENSSSPWKRQSRKSRLKKHNNTETQRQTDSLKVTDGADDHQNGQNPHQHLGDVTNDDHHDQGQNWKTRGLV